VFKKLLLALAAVVLLLVAIPALLIANGTISAGSVPLILNVMMGLEGPPATEPAAQGRYRLPAGFQLDLFAAYLPKARFLRFTAAGDLLVSRPHAGDVVLLRRDGDGDGRSDGRLTVVSGLDRPQGMDFHGDWLYVAERDRVGRLAFDAGLGQATGEYEVVIDGLTGNGNHWSKTLRFGPDGQLYLAQGSTCNVCVERDPRRATMMRFRPDGAGGEVIATGLRNSVGFDWSPFDGGLYATDNGRDLLGDDFPPCELNRVEVGGFYGWPYFNGANVPDPDMGPDPLAGQRSPVAPVHGFRAHNAPLGMTFVDPQHLPPSFQRSALVALHGSWNRSVPDGYKVVSLHWGERGIEERDFLTGFNLDGDISGRPVDVAQGPDGAFYISDDYAGAVYRVSYRGGAVNPATAASAMGAKPVVPPAAAAPAEPPAWVAEADLELLRERGEQLYLQFDCAGCHQRGASPVRLDHLADGAGYARVIEVLQNPQAPMPLYPLERAELRSLAVYLVHRP
jgi:glucose/arabinose dehydrogenase